MRNSLIFEEVIIHYFVALHFVVKEVDVFKMGYLRMIRMNFFVCIAFLFSLSKEAHHFHYDFLTTCTPWLD